jgi:four helix bundle protein
MTKIERFEDVKAWQEARALVRMVYEAVKSTKGFSNDYRFKEQVQSAAVSIMSNISEGFSRRTTKEFIKFLFIAKGSAAEVQSQLYVALDQGYVTQEKFDELYTKSDEVARLISGFIQYLLSKDKHPRNSTNPTNPTNPTNSMNSTNSSNSTNSTNPMNSSNSTN